jgi:hypothetical protein
VAANLEPWVKYGDGIDSKATMHDFVAETPKAAYASTAAALKHPQYHTQKHHLISVNLFGDVPDLSDNAKLIGYDVNHKNNGVCLPTYVVDIVRHDLQCHRGSHPNNLYNVHISPLLSDEEQKCVEYCHADFDGKMDTQMSLIKRLNQISRRIESKVKSWQWLLRTEALSERQDSQAKLAAR